LMLVSSMLASVFRSMARSSQIDPSLRLEQAMVTPWRPLRPATPP
jgi:hypothetical protein